MNEEKKCKILGYGKYPEKETGEIMLRVLIGIDSNIDKYYGLMIPGAVFLKYEQELEDNLKEAIDNNYDCNYTTTDNIITGKTKVDRIIFN